MKQATISALTQAFLRLQLIGSYLYDASEEAYNTGDLIDASLLVSQADKIYQEAENLEILISELGGRYAKVPQPNLRIICFLSKTFAVLAPLRASVNPTDSLASYSLFIKMATKK